MATQYGTVATVVGVAIVAGAVSVRLEPEVTASTFCPVTTAADAFTFNEAPSRVGGVVAFTMTAA